MTKATQKQRGFTANTAPYNDANTINPSARTKPKPPTKQKVKECETRREIEARLDERRLKQELGLTDEKLDNL